MPRLLTGVISLCLMLFVAGCATSPPPAPEILSPTVPEYLLLPQPAPARSVTDNRSLLDLLADYEALRRRSNADRAAVSTILKRLQEQADEE